MKRNRVEKLVSNCDDEAKQGFNITLTATAWQLVDAEAQKRGISRSEIIEQFALSLADDQQSITYQSQQNSDLSTCDEETGRKVAVVLESISDAFVAFDLDWRYTYVNQAAAQLLQKAPQELIGKYVWQEVFIGEVGGLTYHELHRAVAQQIPLSWEEFEQSIGRWLEIRAYPSCEGVTVYFQDITERKRVAEALRQSEKRFRVAQELSLDAFTILQSVRHQTGEIVDFEWTYVNPKAAEILQLSADKLVGQRLLQVLPGNKINSELFDRYVRVVETGEPHDIELSYNSEGIIGWFRNMAVKLEDGVAVSFSDIGERKRTQQALYESEKRFRRLVESNMFGVAFGKFTGEIDYANDYFLNMVGYDREDLLSGQMQWMQMTPPEFLHLDAQAGEELKKSGIATPFEKEYIRKDGKRIPILIGAVLLQEPYDQQQEIIGFYLDLSKRKQAEAAWREGKQILDAIMEYIPEGITIADAPDVNICRVSKYGQQLIGRSPDILEGIPATEHPQKWGILHNDGTTSPTPEELPLTRAVKQGEVVTNEEWVIQRPDGQKISILCNAGPIRNQNGQTTGGVIAWRNITERKQAEEKLRQALQRLNFHVDNTPMGVIEWDRDFRVIRWSNTAERILGWTAKEVVGKQLSEIPFVYVEDAKPVSEVCHRLVVGQESQIFSYNRNYKKDGSVIHCEWYNSSLRDESGTMTSVLSLILDVSDRKIAEAEREYLLQQEQAARAEAEKANRIKDEFLAVLSHELRTPLNPILGWSRLLQSQKLNPAKTTEALKTIERNAKLQAQLIEDLLDVSRILQGKLTLNVTPVDLTSIISGAMETVQLAAEAKSIKIHTLLEPNVGKVAGDPSRLQQVVWNLLSNAIKFTPSAGQVEIRLERLGSHAEITVSDNGKGITLDFMPYVFDYFRQADSTITRKFGGLGLGLAIVRRLVELHGGTVVAHSLGEGLGATFKVSLPIIPNQEPPNQDTKQIKEPSDLSGIKVLVVDDDADSREFVAFILEHEGAEVVTASSASQALAILSQCQPDILLSDIGMPLMDGYMLMQHLRALPPEKGGKIKAIALTAYAGEINEKKAIKAGFQRHISKPVEPVDLVNVISQLTVDS